MKIAFFKEIISPEVGAYLAGYSLNDKSVMKLDDLYATGLCVDDGTNKVLLISLDLLGLDGVFIQRVRKECAAILSVPESAVMITPTHTHTGPETRTLAAKPEQLNTAYLEKLEKTLLKAVEGLKDFRECKTYFYSSTCDENRSRRYVTADNHSTFTPHRREVLPCAIGFADKELGQLYFTDAVTGLPVYVVGNYAAHPLAGHCPGLGGLRISADFPGAFRDYILAETGAEAMFVSGAAGDMVPREDELGSEAAKGMGIRLAKGVLGGMMDATRNPGRFLMKDAKVGSSIRTFTVPLRKKYRNNPKRLPAPYLGKDDVTLEIQCLAIGDICFVGVPGELCAELGQEIKWHSPFRRTFIAYDATAYFSYIGPANFFVAGGYEAFSQRFTARGGLELVKTASDAMFDLREELYPSEEADDPYPDNCADTLVNIPPNR
ncbi:MAG: hypothetical protein J6S58_03520 [Lentisphaeria bacterium]|nr:hypothetical protein [Lentisphaeria bacterium]